MVEDHAGFTISGGLAVVLNTTGAWSVGKHEGTGLDFAVGEWVAVELELNYHYVSASVNGKLLHNSTDQKAPSDWAIKVALDRYIYASIDNFKIEAI
jgi:hypothetical protein